MIIGFTVMIWFLILILFGVYLPVSLAVGGVLALAWEKRGKLTLLMAFLAGMLMDINSGSDLGRTSLYLILTALVTFNIKEHWPQWWVLLITAAVAGLIWSFLVYGKISIWSIVGCVGVTLIWHFIIWYASGRHRGVYLKR